MDSIPKTMILSEFGLLHPATFAIAAITTVTSLYIYFLHPSLLLKAYFRLAVKWSGMKMNYTNNLGDGFRFFYGEKGQPVPGQRTILLLHGFSADHFMFANIVKHFPSHVHVIALDLPGHGFSSDPLESDKIGFLGQVERVKQFVEEVKLPGPFHVVGVSMGGTIAGLFAARFPHLVGCLSITCPSMKTPEESTIIVKNKSNVLDNGGALTLDNCPMLPQTPQALQEMLDVCHYYNVKFPKQILKGALDLRVQKNLFYLELAQELISDTSQVLLESSLDRITCPTQVIWGKQDMVVHVSGTDVLQSKLPCCQRVDILPECGHAINLDQPGLYAKVLIEFWRSHSVV